MKKFILLLLIICLCGCTKDKSFYIEDKFYNSSEGYTILDKDEYNEKIKNKESFILFVFSPGCITSSNLSNLMSEFSTNNKISYYSINFEDIEETNIKDYLEYYPSVILIKNGKMVDFLESDKDQDLMYYESVDELTKWIFSYVKVKD